MTEPSPVSNPDLDLLVQAAGNADAVRLAALVRDYTATGAETFTRPLLVAQWTARWRHHTTMPGNRRPEQRVSRSLPVLIAVEAVTGVQGPDIRVLYVDVLEFLAGRLYMAEALDVQAPASNTLPVGEQTRAQAASLVQARQPGYGLGQLSAAAAVIRGGRGRGGGEGRLSATAEVVAGG